MKVSEISSHLRVTSPSVTQMVTALEAQGLVLRRMDPTDRRIVRVSLTEQGRQAIRQAERGMSDAFSELIHRMGEEKLLQLADLLCEVGAISAQLEPSAEKESGAQDPGRCGRPCHGHHDHRHFNQ